MHRRLVGASLLLAALFALPSMDAVAQGKKKKDGPKRTDVPVDSAKLSGEFVGVLKTVPGTERLFTVDTETKKLVPTGKGGKGGNANTNRILNLQNQIAQQQIRVNTARTAQQRLQAAQQMQRLQLQLQQAVAQLQLKATTGKGDAPPGFKWETKKQAIEFQAAETVKVRSMFLPEQFDDKGNLKTYTEKEKAELKGKDRTLPGYESSLEKLEVGQKVRVKLSPAPRRPAAKDKDKDKDKDSDPEAKDADKKMQVTQIVILEEGSGAPVPKDKRKGKKAK